MADDGSIPNPISDETNNQIIKELEKFARLLEIVGNLTTAEISPDIKPLYKDRISNALQELSDDIRPLKDMDPNKFTTNYGLLSYETPDSLSEKYCKIYYNHKQGKIGIYDKTNRNSFGGRIEIKYDETITVRNRDRHGVEDNYKGRYHTVIYNYTTGALEIHVLTKREHYGYGWTGEVLEIYELVFDINSNTLKPKEENFARQVSNTWQSDRGFDI